MSVTPGSPDAIEDIQADVAVVGAGPAGITLARELAARGAHVVLLESGGVPADGSNADLNDGRNDGLPNHPLRTSRIRGYGGTSNHWHEHGWFRARPLDAHDFSAAGRDHDGWPISRAELDPFYARAHEHLRLGAYDYDTSTYVSADRPELPWVGPVFETSMFKLTRPGVWTSTLTDVRTRSGIRLVSDATVVRIDIDARGDVTGLRTATRNGNAITVMATRYVLAAGGIENPRLLLASTGPAHPTGLGNRHDLVGRYFLEHPHLRGGVIVPGDPSLLGAAGLYDKHDAGEGHVHVQGKLALRPDVVRREGLLGAVAFVRGVSRHRGHPGVRSGVTLRRAITYRPRPDDLGAHARRALADLPAVAAAGAQVLRRRFTGTPVPEEQLELEFMLEQEPTPSSRLRLTDERDRLGLPRVALEWRSTGRERTTLQRTVDLLGQALAEGGWGHLRWTPRDLRPPEPAKPAWHHMGTTRMHPDPQAGVVDADARVHGTTNLYVAGSSVFPTVGYANPTLTIVALAVRLADHLGTELA